MLTQGLIKASKQLQMLELEDYKKVINYSINLILNHENQMKLNQFIQIDQQKGDDITNICLSLIQALVKYRTSIKQLDNDLNLLLISKERKQYLRQKLQAQLYYLRKVIYEQDLQNITNFRQLNWRFEAQVGSKTSKNTFIPNFYVSIQLQQKGINKKSEFNSDFATLKHLHQSLLQAIKLHNSTKFKSARNSSV